MKKTFESLTKKMTKKKKKLERKDQERNWRDRQKECLKKSYMIPICFWKLKSDWSRGIEQESNFTWKHARLIKKNRAGIEGTQDFELKNLFFFLHISIGWKINSINRILKKQIFEKFWKFFFFCRIIWKTIFMIWHVCSWLQMMFKIKLFKDKFKLYQISLLFAFLTP